MVKVKICGITNLDDAIAAVDAGCSALGFVFYKKSPRYIKPQDAAKIIKCLPKKIIKVGVFVNARGIDIRRIAKLCRLDMLQFHGNESPGFCAKFKGHKIIKAFRLKKAPDLKEISRYKTFAYLFDTFVESKIGGTGQAFNWQTLRKIRVELKPQVFLSGGLNARNVQRAIKLIRPDWVDASSSLELAPGKKDHKKVKKFIQKVIVTFGDRHFANSLFIKGKLSKALIAERIKDMEREEE